MASQEADFSERDLSGYVCRIRDNSNLSELVEERPLSNMAKQAGVISDALVRLGYKNQRPDHPVRVVQVRTTPHTPPLMGWQLTWNTAHLEKLVNAKKTN